MQIAFYDPNDEILTPQKKGLLFERFTEKLVALCGYRNIVLRAKHASLEYDIEATKILHDDVLVGEAKAHVASMSGKEVSAFVGKLYPLAMKHGKVDGLFISVSEFTPEARNFIRSLEEQGKVAPQINLKTLSAGGIIDFLASNSECISDEALRRLAKDRSGFEVADTWLVVSDQRYFFVATLNPNPVASANQFAAFSTDGGALDLVQRDVENLKSQIPDLEDLDYVSSPSDMFHGEVHPQKLPEVMAGVGWFDYKFPSPPDCFVGRHQALDEVNKFLENVRTSSTGGRAVQVLSRSGVGKSSLLLKIAETASHNATVTVDGRNLRAPSDLRLVLTEMISQANSLLGCHDPIPKRKEEIQESIQAVGCSLSRESRIGILQIDQFEALLSRPPVFQAVLDLIIDCTSLKLPIVWVMARKNDLAATYDAGAEIDLAQLNQISTPISLEDFSPEEESTLLSQLEKETNTKLTSEFSDALLTFSSGFPWLLKRVCAHVIKMSREGISQTQLQRGGLRAEDLFSEDLAGLEENDKALLKTLAAHMPNTFREISRRLEGEVSGDRLTRSLNDFLGRKLLRLSGDVYDTYNDVFKAYLMTDRVPFQTRFVFRVTPRPALALMAQIQEYGPTDMGRFTSMIGGNATATYNKLRELRLLGFLDPNPGHIALSAEARSALESDTLGDFLRRALRTNSLVISLLDLVANNRAASFEQIAQMMKRELPHIEVNEKTWAQYSSIMVNWVRYAGMVDVEGDYVHQKAEFSDELILRREFTQGNFSAGTFLPSARPGQVCNFLKFLVGGEVGISEIREEFTTRWASALVRDARALDLVDDVSDQIFLTAKGRALVASSSELKDRDVALQALSKKNVAALIAAASEGPVDFGKQREILSQFGSANWTDGTWKWRLGVLVSWVKASGEVVSTKKGLIAAKSL